MALPLQAAYSQKLLDGEILKLKDIALKIYNLFKYPQDAEWCIENGKIYILQARPITSGLPALPESQRGAIPVSKGIGIGMPWTDIKHIPKRKVILVADEISMPIVKYLKNKNIAGIVAQYDGMLSHIGILSRELGIPYITGVSCIAELAKAKLLKINGFNGEIAILQGKKEAKVAAQASTYNWVHKDIKNLYYIKESKALFRRLKGFVILYSEGESIKPNSFKDSEIVLSGPCSIQDSYGLLFRSIYANIEGIKGFKAKMVEALNAYSCRGLERLYSASKEKIIRYYSNAKTAYYSYASTGSTESLITAYINSVKSYIYFNAVRNAMFDYFEFVFGLCLSTKSMNASDSELYNAFNDLSKGKLLKLRKTALWILNDLVNVAMEGREKSAIDFEEKISAELKSKLGISEYEKIVKANFG